MVRAKRVSDLMSVCFAGANVKSRLDKSGGSIKVGVNQRCESVV